MAAYLNFDNIADTLQCVGEYREALHFVPDPDLKGVRNIAFKMSLLATALINNSPLVLLGIAPYRSILIVTRSVVCFTGALGNPDQKKEAFLQSLTLLRYIVVAAERAGILNRVNTYVLFYASVGAEMLTRVNWYIKG